MYLQSISFGSGSGDTAIDKTDMVSTFVDLMTSGQYRGRTWGRGPWRVGSRRTQGCIRLVPSKSGGRRTKISQGSEFQGSEEPQEYDEEGSEG